MSSRPISLQAAYAVVEKEFGEEKAKALFVENPMAAYEGNDLPWVPELEDERVEKTRSGSCFLWHALIDSVRCDREAIRPKH